MFKYPFNKYGFEDKFISPIRQIFRRQKIFKNVELYPWDLVNIYETIFAQFEAFCKNRPNSFIDRYCSNAESVKQSNKCCGKNIYDDEFMYDNYKAFRRLQQIEEYVLYTRKLNKIKLDTLSDIWHSSYRSYWEKSDLDENAVELKIMCNYCCEVQFDIEFNELVYTLNQVNYKTDFNPINVENVLRNLDIKIAKDIVELSSYIWD